MGLFDLFKKKDKPFTGTCNEVIVNGVIDARDGHYVDTEHLPKEVKTVLLPDNKQLSRSTSGVTDWVVTNTIPGMYDDWF